MRPRRGVLASLLLLLGSAKATAPTPDGPTAASVPPAVAYGDVVSAAVELLNARSVSPYVLRLREAQPRPGWPAGLQHRQELSFTVEETSCRAPGTATAACKSRWLGAVSWCRGFVFLEQQQPTVELSCDKVPNAFGRFGKSRLSDFFTRIKERFGGFIQCGKIWIRDKLDLNPPKP
ncbi:cathelicidin-B1-like [Tyto alba]|uniref:cathelicidin-B1-like n=1 Tax=Tyto alba TaxID=56313 RepID=UPI0014028780|nr:cathelicidin-B1-like [Tyto alba]